MMVSSLRNILKISLNHTNLDEKKFFEIIDKFRSPHLWDKINGKWILKGSLEVMLKPRIIARMDIKNANLIKSINLEGLKIIGNPNEYAKKYYEDGADEILFMDCVATLYGRNNLSEMIYESTKDIFVPIAVGGGIRSFEDVKMMLNSGAE